MNITTDTNGFKIDGTFHPTGDGNRYEVINYNPYISVQSANKSKLIMFKKHFNEINIDGTVYADLEACLTALQGAINP